MSQQLPSPLTLSFQKLILLFVALSGTCWHNASAVSMLYGDSLPETLTGACSKALVSDVACDQAVRSFCLDSYYSLEILTNACSSTCKSALDSYWDAVKSACGNETIIRSYDLEVSALMIPGMFKDLFQKICLQDKGRYCNNVAATAAVIADPGDSEFNYFSSVPSGTVPPDPCDMCFIKSLKLKAGSPYFDGPELARMSAYMSLTSKCGVTGQPLTTTSLGFYTEEPKTTPTPCMGEKYSIQPGDDCYSISRTQKVGTAWLLLDNNLASYCADFPTSGDLCISKKCEVYTVKTNDTCASIAKSANITAPQLHAWNPIINAGCYNMHRLNGTQLCISAPGKKFVPRDVTDLPGATVTTPAPVPSDVAFGISMENFIFLNPALNSNCTNLYAEESYCVLPVGDINTYPGKPGYMTSATGPAPTVVETPFSSRPEATALPYERLYPDLPIAEGTRDDCNSYFDGEDYQFDVTNTIWSSNCEIPVEIYNVDPESFATWNAGLGNISNPECSFKPGFRYCGSYYPEGRNTQKPTPATSHTDSTSTSMTPTNPSPMAPTMTGQPSTCNKWHTVTNGESCDILPKKYGITREQFLAWNPTIKSDCSANFWAGYAYCVGIESASTITSSTGLPSSTPTRPPADKIQPGAADNCTKWDRAASGDHCTLLAERNKITIEQLATWNPVLGDNGAKCDSMFWASYYYCTAVQN